MNTEQIVGILAAIFASSGFWTLINNRMQKKDNEIEKKSTQGEMLRGLGHDRICYLGSIYIKQGYITRGDYENLHDYLYVPYHKLGGNGTAERIMQEVKQLPLKERKDLTNGVHK